MEVNVPVLLESATQITCPTLFLRGSEENAELYPAEQFAKACPAKVDVRIIDDCNHFYAGHEAEVGALLADWLVAGASETPDD
jgi:pimeloyl-ACP methyl ester carboxylesterase